VATPSTVPVRDRTADDDADPASRRSSVRAATPTPARPPQVHPAPQRDLAGRHELRLRRTWWSLGAGLAALALLTTMQLVLNPGAVSVVIVALVAVVALAVAFHARSVRDLEHERQQAADSFSRILRGLSRSVSPDAIVEAIVEDLGEAAAADHTVVVRLRPEGRLLEATLVSSRAGVPSSTTLLPPSDLEDPGPGGISTGVDPVAVAGSESRGESVPGATRGIPVMASRPLSRLARPFASHLVDDDAADRIARRIAERVGGVYGLRNTIAAPLRIDEAVVGAIVLSRRLADGWSDASVRLLSDAAGEASAALARAYSHRAAETRASTDALTGLPNRRYFEEFCGLLARRRRSDDALGVLMVDIDHFKLLNDQFGHPVGDAVLKAVAEALARAVREEDVPARFGGEEFAVLLRNPAPGVALEVGERIRSAVANLDLSKLGPGKVTVSVGVAMARSAEQPISELIDAADGALYRAKRLGRDRVVAA
jgi:diguanylate cyclase (GGDEF)-like protein